MIPKIIHYCWFGGNEMDTLSLKCLKSWENHLYDYQIIRWDEKQFDLSKSNHFVREAYDNKKWAFVSDYVQAYALFNFGGIYLDTDVEIKQSLDIFLNNRAFSGFEKENYPFTAVWGAEKNHPWPQLVLDYYQDRNDFEETTNTSIVSDILVKKYNVDRNTNKLQYLNDGVAIYPSDTFCVDIPTNYACHHFNGSWASNDIDDKGKISWKQYITDDYYEQKYKDTITRNGLGFIEAFLKKITFKHLLKEIFRRIINKIINQR